jgi:hypothetical protein
MDIDSSFFSKAAPHFLQLEASGKFTQ